MLSELDRKRIDTDPTHRLYFCRVRLGFTRKTAYKHMVILILGQAIGKLSPIDKGADLSEITCRAAQLLLKSPWHGVGQRLTRTWMRAAGISPEATGVILAMSTLRDKHLGPLGALAKEHNRKGPMKQSLKMGLCLARHTERTV